MVQQKNTQQKSAEAGPDAFLRFIAVKKTYDHKTLVVKDFNLDVAKGEFITLLGPSGSGKTTCLMMLAGFEDVTSGEILINGRSVTDIARHGVSAICTVSAHGDTGKSGVSLEAAQAVA